MPASTTTPARATALVSLLFLGGVTLGSVGGWAAVARAQDPYAGLETFARALTTIEAQYIEPVEQDALIDAAIRGMVGQLDDHSRWLDAEAYRALVDDTDGAYYGIGVEVRHAPEVVISRVLGGSPAERAGLTVGDQVQSIDGISLRGLSLHDIEVQFRGKRGSTAQLLLLREGWDGPHSVDVVRDKIDLPSVQAARLDDVLYLRLLQFQRGSGTELRSAWEAQTPAPRSIVLDLRDNPGGLLEEAIAVADLFLADGVIVATERRTGGRVEHRATASTLPGVPLVVLINGRSASASEIVAAALQDRGRATLVGTRSYGKGSVQSVFPYPDGGALKLTIGRYYTPSGAPVADHQGRQPDVVVPYPPSHGNARDELRGKLKAAPLADDERAQMLDLLDQLDAEGVPSPPIRWDLPAAERIKVDPQLRRALELVR